MLDLSVCFQFGSTWARMRRTPSILPMCELSVEAVGSCADVFGYAREIAETAREREWALISSWLIFNYCLSHSGRRGLTGSATTSILLVYDMVLIRVREVGGDDSQSVTEYQS